MKRVGQLAMGFVAAAGAYLAAQNLDQLKTFISSFWPQ